MIYKMSLVAILALALTTTTAMAETVQLTVNINGAEPPTGSIEVSLFNSDETFLKAPYAQRPCIPANDGSCTVHFGDLAPGDYAVVVVHDANGNKKLDSGFLGFGAEGFAYSNDASNPLFGRASFDDVRISVAGSTEIVISLD